MKLRMFIAVPFEMTHLQILAQYQSSVISKLLAEERCRKVRITPVQNLHITVSFLGNLEENSVNTICSHLCKITRSQSPFQLIFEEFTLAPTVSHPRMLWGEYKSCLDFDKLSQLIETQCKPNNTRLKDPRPGRPHVTLARFDSISTDPTPLRTPFHPTELNLQVSRIELWSSHLSSSGSTYTCLSQFSLGS